MNPVRGQLVTKHENLGQKQMQISGSAPEAVTGIADF